jgi:hypothetical protein
MNCLNEHHIRLIGFRQDNTDGYTQEQLDALNCELFRTLDGTEPESDEWFDVAKSFADTVNRR